MSKHWKPEKTTVALAAGTRPAARKPGSRIRRDPVPVSITADRPKRPANRRERELFLGVVGILVFAAAIGTVITMLAMFTVFRDDPEADAKAMQFSQCYNAQGPNCVADGGTIYVGGDKIEIAGIDAPKIGDAKCDDEHDRGVVAATMLAEILNSGPVTIGSPFRDPDGRTVSKVEVKGGDVALRMIDQGLAHEAGSGLGYCHQG